MLPGAARRRSLLASAVLVLFAASACASVPDDPITKQLDAAYLRDSNEAIALAHRLLAQPGKLDSPETIAANSYLCESYSDLNRYDEAVANVPAAERAIPARPTGDEVEYSTRLLTCWGFAMKQKQRLTDAMGYFDRAVTLADANRSAVPAGGGNGAVVALSYALYRRAGTYDTLGDAAAALADLTRALRLLPDDPNDSDLVAQRMNIASAIGHLHMRRQEYAEAVVAYEDVLKSTQALKDDHSEAIIRINLGECYLGLQRWKDAQEAYGRALAIGARLKDQGLVGRAHAGLGALARARNDDAAALTNLDLAHTELAAAQMSLELRNVDLQRAQTLADMGRWQDLAALSGQLVANFTATGDKRLLSRALDLRARASEGRGDLQAALADTRREVALQDEIRRSELDEELARRNTDFEVVELKDRARQLERENLVARLQIQVDNDVSLMQRVTIAVAVGIALLLAFSVYRRIRIQRLLTRLALEDALTGLRNRRATLAGAGELFEGSRRANTPLSLALLDIDHFKRINDTWGHAAGDAVLVAVATCMRESLRTDDICGRVGGEEFLFVFPRCDLDHAAKLLEGIRAAISGLRVEGLPADYQVSLSAGLTGRRHGDDQLDALVRRADEALYAAKNAGRNRVVIDRP